VAKNNHAIESFKKLNLDPGLNIEMAKHVLSIASSNISG